MIPTYVSKLRLKVQATRIRAQKINSSNFQILRMVCVSFQVENKLGKIYFFQETFLIADTSIEFIFEMLFLSLSNADVKFAKKELT